MQKQPLCLSESFHFTHLTRAQVHLPKVWAVSLRWDSETKWLQNTETDCLWSLLLQTYLCWYQNKCWGLMPSPECGDTLRESEPITTFSRRSHCNTSVEITENNTECVYVCLVSMWWWILPENNEDSDTQKVAACLTNTYHICCVSAHTHTHTHFLHTV